MDTELKFIDVNPFMKKIYDYAKSKNKKIIYISDMYLSSNQIYKLLEKAGYKKDKLYVSCETKSNKGSKSLYELVYKENKLDKSSWLHIGDNIVSDYNNPIEFGINAYNYKNVREYDKSIMPKSIEESIITAIQTNKVYNGLELDYWEKFGILNVSPLYFGYSFWLYNLTKDKDNLFFLARDGYIFEKIFNYFPKTNLFTNYIYCSRKSLQIPALYDCDEDYLTYVVTIMNDFKNNTIKLKDFFKVAQLDYNDEKYLPIIRLFNFDSFEDIIDDNNYENMKKLMASQIDDIKKNIKEQRDLVIAYLNQEGMDKYEKINVVDVGWAGSIQFAIEKLLKKKVTGYYFGTIINQKANNYSTMFGYYFDLGNKEEDRREIIDNIMMYELLFSAPHGTTKSYKKVNGKIEYILGEDDNNEIVERFQNAALSIIKKYIEYYEYSQKIDKYFATYRFRKMIKDKNYEDMYNFSKLSNDMVLGSDKKYSYVKEFEKRYINKNFKQFLKDSSSSIWKGAYLIKDGTPEDYKKINKRIDKIKNIKIEVKKVGRCFIPFRVRRKMLNTYRKIANRNN